MKQVSTHRTNVETLWVKRIFFGLLVVVIFLYGYSLAWSKIGQYATRRFRAEIKKVTQKLNIPIEYGKVKVTTSGIVVEELRIGQQAPIVISQVRFQLDLNPLSDDFTKLSLLSIRDAKVKTPLANLDEWNKIFEKKAIAVAPQKETSVTDSRLLDQLIAASPATVFEIASAGVVILSDQGNQLLALKGLKLNLNKRQKKLVFVIDRIRRADGPLDGNLQGRLELNPNGAQKDYRFFVRRKSSPSSKKNLWSVAGVVAKDLSKWLLIGHFRSLPTFFGNELENFLGKNPQIGLKTRIEGLKSVRPTTVGLVKNRNHQTLGDLWNLDIDIESTQTFIDSKLMSTSIIGPIPFKIHAKAQVDPSMRTLTIPQGSILLPIKESVSLDPAHIEMGFSLKAQKSLATAKDSLKISAQWNLPETSCENLIKAMPPHLIPLPQEFKLEGTTSAQVTIDYDSADMDASQIQLARSMWNCRIIDAPYDLSRESLSGPFEIQPKKGSPQELTDEPALSLRISPENPRFASIATIPKNVIQAFVSAEDTSFYSHQGIETHALLGAFRKNLSEGRVAVGGSTITMQTAKNLFLSHERTFSRKLQELFLAWHLEKSLTKDRIMEIYLNIIEFAPNIYGIGHASRHFFNKEVQNLSLYEAVYLANTLPNPKLRYASFCQGRLTPGMTSLMTSLLKRMQNLGRISQEEALQAMSLGIRFSEEKRAADSICPERTAVTTEGHEEKSRL